MPGRKKLHPVDRFMQYVNTDGALILDSHCWEWTGAVFRDGRGHFVTSPPRRDWNAHRWLYERAYGIIPEGMNLCHRCDNPKCVRPTHMFVGTQRENLADMDAKGRRGDCRHFGTKNAAAKLTEDDVRTIRAVYTGKFGQIAELARQYGVTATAVGRMLHGHTWKQVD